MPKRRRKEKMAVKKGILLQKKKRDKRRKAKRQQQIKDWTKIGRVRGFKGERLEQFVQSMLDYRRSGK